MCDKVFIFTFLHFCHFHIFSFSSAELTQREIRDLETKLVRMFSELLITKAKLPERLPRGLPATGAELKQWLRVVGK